MDLGNLSITVSSDPLGELIEFCNKNNIDTPQIESYCRKVVGCRLTVEGKSFFEYGQSESEARVKVAQTALTHLKMAEKLRSFPVAKMDTHELAIRLHDVLLGYPQGVLEKSLPEIFLGATGFSLPDHWTDVVAAYNRFFCVDSTALAHVIYANETEIDQVMTVAQLELPWKLRQWSVFITHVLSTNMIWARIIGAEYSDRFDKLLVAIEKHQTESANQKVVEEIQESTIYLVKWAGGWHRIHAREINAENKRVLCFFVDHGNEEELPKDQVFVCDPRFQVLPAQAQLFSLFGLDNMEDNPHSLSILEKRLLDKALVTEIITKADGHVPGSAIRCVFYDTSGAEDVNLTEKIHEEICAAGQPPQFNSTGPTQVVISAISDRGEVFCQIPGSGLNYIQTVLDKLKDKTELLERHRGLRTDAGDSPTQYLIFDRPNSTWCRAVLRMRQPQTKCHIFDCIDTGRQVTAAEADTYHLEPMSRAVSRYPAMALRCELYDVPKMDSRLASRVKGLLEPGSMVLAKIMVAGGYSSLPKVNLYKRLPEASHNIIVCINDTLRMEHAFECI